MIIGRLKRTTIIEILSLLLIFPSLIIVAIWTHAQELGNPLPDNSPIITSENLAQLQPLDIGDDIRQIIFSPDDLMMAIAHQTLDNNFAVQIINIETNDIIDTLQGRMDSFEELIWSPDSEKVAIISSRITGGGIEIYAIKTYTIGRNDYLLGNSDALLWLEYPATTDDTPITISWHPVEDLIAVGFRDELRIFDTMSSEVYETRPITDIIAIDWSNDGALLLVRADNEMIALAHIVEN